jgi:uncharacterized protein (TIGR02284 family)
MLRARTLVHHDPKENAMAMDRDDVVDTLNDLIETCKDGEEGFRTCAEDIKRVDLKPLFERAALRCAEGARELQSLVQAYGGKPERTGSFAGSAHRRWVDIKSAITGKDDAAVLAECERGEDVAKESYEKALQKELPPDVRAVVERQYQGVLQHHDAVRNLERTAKATS